MTSLPIEKILDYHPVIYCVIDQDSKFLYASTTTAALLGYQPQELVGVPFLNFVMEQDREKTRYILEQLYTGRLVDRFENRYCHKDGSIVTLQWSSQWDGYAQRLYSIAHPVSRESSIEQLQQAFAHKLRQNNQKHFEAFDRITDGFYTLDEAWRFTYINKAVEQHTGVSKAALLAQVVWEMFPEARGTIMEKELKRCFEKQVSVRYETFYPHPLNKWFDVSAYPSPSGISVFFRDITDRKNAEEETRTLSLIVRHTDNLVVLCDVEGRTTWVNEAFVQKTGYNLEEALGKRPGDLLAGPLTDRNAIKQSRRQYRKVGHFNEELLYYTKSKKKFWVAVTGQMTYDEGGRPKALFSIMTDITERKQLQEQLAREQQARQQKITAAVIQAQEQERSEIGKELHDNVNQLLTTVKLYLEVSLNPEIERENLTQKSIQLLQHTIGEIRSLSRQLSAPTIEKVTLSESIKELCDAMATANKFKVHLETSGIAALEVEQKLHLALYRILQEHLTNIIRHAAAQEVVITLALVDGALQLKVRDDGKGFNIKEKRSGIGITNMRTRAESLHGTFTINSTPGKGTDLEVRLPLDIG